MRLHRLELTAFGPFAGTEEVDFEQLGEAGLYLVSGPTGAGKTTVLDAVCFALYGQVPGPRRGRGGLRSDHAEDGVAPRVLCELSVGHRRLEITRSPEWHRPKRRGAGVVREPARAVLRERRPDGGWEPLSSRLDEIGDVVLDLLGMGVDQFTSLVLLPQGQFAAFLRAPSQDRQPMLERLFQTQRFARVEQWLKKRRSCLSADVAAASAETSMFLAVAESAASVLDTAGPDGEGDRRATSVPDPGVTSPVAPGAPDHHRPPAATSASEAVARVRQLAGTCARAREEADAVARLAVASLQECRTAVRNGETQLERLTRRAALESRLETLLTGAADQEDRRLRLASADAAGALTSRLSDLATAEAHRRSTAEGLDRARREMTRVLAAAPADDRPGEDAALLRERLGALAPAVHDAAHLAATQEQLRTRRASLDDVETALTASSGLLDEVTGRVDGLARDLREAETTAADLPARRSAADRAREALLAVADRDRLHAEAQALETTERHAVQDHQSAQQRWLDLREQRLAGMAAELAGRLAPDTPCPVCGSPTHPEPAALGPGHVTRAQEEDAAAAARAAAARREEAEARSRAVREELAAARARAGDLDPTDAGTLAERALAQVRAGEQAAAAAQDLSGRLRAARTTTAELVESRAQAQALVDTLRLEVSGLAERCSGLQSRVDAARGSDPDVATRHERLLRAVDAAERLADAVREDAAAEAGLSEARDRAEGAAAGAGFTDLDAARAAALPEPERRRLAAEADGYDEELGTVRARLADPSTAASPGPAPDVPLLRAAEQEAAAQERTARALLTRATDAAQRLADVADRLERHALRTRPLQEEYDLIDALSRCTEGSGGDNTMRMRLSAYVLAARLEQVAEAANVRLLAMSGGRYRLVHTDARASRGALSGLGLAVIDGWTGVQRDTTSLSGGEAFYASLALALGLADVLAAEAGGTSIDTLLVDEGFGGLDADTLDEVMDVLDGLRAGGRAVGLVSHVTDLRDRIPTRLDVIKTRTGSRLRIGAGAAVG